jgi:hypothetical protein
LTSKLVVGQFVWDVNATEIVHIEEDSGYQRGIFRWCGRHAPFRLIAAAHRGSRPRNFHKPPPLTAARRIVSNAYDP